MVPSNATTTAKSAETAGEEPLAAVFGLPLAVGSGADKSSAPAVIVTGAKPNRSPLVQLYLYVEYVPFHAVFRVYQTLPTWVRLQTAETVPLRLQRLISVCPGPKCVPVNKKVAGPWVIVLGGPVVLLTLPSWRVDASVGEVIVALSVGVLVGSDRWSTRVVVITYVVSPASMFTTEPESRCKRVYGRPSKDRSSTKKIWTTLVTTVGVSVEVSELEVVVDVGSDAELEGS